MGHQVNAGFTVLAELVPGRVAEARALLATYRADPTRLPFATTVSTHFATLTVIDADVYGPPDRQVALPARLLVATSVAGPIREHVEELARGTLGTSLRALLACCVGFAPGCDDADFVEYLLDRREADTFYSGMQHLAPLDVRRHRELREAIEDYLGAIPAFDTQDPIEIRARIQAHVRARFPWAAESFAPPPIAWWVLKGRGLLLSVPVLGLGALTLAALVCGGPLRLVAGLAWGAVAVFVGGMFVLVREAEREQTYVSPRQPDARVRALAATQNRPVINEFVIAGPIKEEGRIRPLFLRMAMWVVARAAVGIPLIPKLSSGISIPTVATARWIPADRGRRLIFISNYTNAAEPYVRDFIDVHDGAQRINITFGFGRGYPKTRWVLLDGAVTDPNGFLNVVAENQHETGFWYGPYHDMSIDNIVLDRAIREGLFAKLPDDPKLAAKAAQDWLHLL